MRSDAQLRSDVQAELDWDPEIKSSSIGVIANEGVVTLTGHVGSHAEKYAAERVAQRVKVNLRGRVHSWADFNAAQGAAWSAPGVSRVVNDLVVRD